MFAGSAGLQAVLKKASWHNPGWNRITQTLPHDAAKDAVSIKVDTSTGEQLTRQTTMTTSQQSGKITADFSFADRSKTTRARM